MGGAKPTAHLFCSCTMLTTVADDFIDMTVVVL